MIKTLTINGLLIGQGTANYSIHNAKGFGASDVRLSQYEVPQRHRIQVPRAYYGGRRMTIEIGIRADTVANYQIARDNLLKAFDLPRSGLTTLLIRTLTDRLLQTDVQLAAPIDSEFTTGLPTMGTAFIDLIAPDPLFYGQTLNSTDITAIGGAGTVCANAGNAPVYPILHIYGGITNPIATNRTANKVLLDTQVISNTNFDIVSMEFATAILNSTPANITQITSKSTGVILNLLNGTITMNSAALAGGASVAFVLTDAEILATDILTLSYSAGTVGAYQLSSVSAAGSATITVKNITTGSLSEAIVITFAANRSVIGGFTGDFWQLLIGNNTIVFDGSAAGANKKLVVKWRDGWLGL